MPLSLQENRVKFSKGGFHLYHPKWPKKAGKAAWISVCFTESQAAELMISWILQSRACLGLNFRFITSNCGSFGNFFKPSQFVFLFIANKLYYLYCNVSTGLNDICKICSLLREHGSCLRYNMRLLPSHFIGLFGKSTGRKPGRTRFQKGVWKHVPALWAK